MCVFLTFDICCREIDSQSTEFNSQCLIAHNESEFFLVPMFELLNEVAVEFNNNGI